MIVLFYVYYSWFLNNKKKNEDRGSGDGATDEDTPKLSNYTDRYIHKYIVNNNTWHFLSSDIIEGQ